MYDSQVIKIVRYRLDLNKCGLFISCFSHCSKYMGKNKVVAQIWTLTCSYSMFTFSGLGLDVLVKKLEQQKHEHKQMSQVSLLSWSQLQVERCWILQLKHLHTDGTVFKISCYSQKKIPQAFKASSCLGRRASDYHS